MCVLDHHLHRALAKLVVMLHLFVAQLDLLDHLSEQELHVSHSFRLITLCRLLSHEVERRFR